MKIETKDFLTIEQARAQIGCSRRAFYRAIDRAEAAGCGDMTTVVLGKRLVPKFCLASIAEHYYPQGSEQRAVMSKAWGQQGGLTKAKNASRRAKRA